MPACGWIALYEHPAVGLWKQDELQKRLLNAAASDDVEAAQGCLQHGAAAAWVSVERGGQSALHVAADKGSEAVLRELLKRVGRNIEVVKARDGRGWTPLHWAAHRGHTAVATLLVRAVTAPGTLELPRQRSTDRVGFAVPSSRTQAKVWDNNHGAIHVTANDDCLVGCDRCSPGKCLPPEFVVERERSMATAPLSTTITRPSCLSSRRLALLTLAWVATWSRPCPRGRRGARYVPLLG